MIKMIVNMQFLLSLVIFKIGFELDYDQWTFESRELEFELTCMKL